MKKQKKQPENTQIYVVSSNETLTGLCIKFNTPTSTLMSLNRLSTTQLFPGMELYVPDTVDLKSITASMSNEQSKKTPIAVSRNLDLPPLPDLSSFPIPSNKSSKLSPIVFPQKIESNPESKLLSESNSPNTLSQPVGDSKDKKAAEKSDSAVGWHLVDSNYYKGVLSVTGKEVSFFFEKGPTEETRINIDDIKNTKILPSLDKKFLDQVKEELDLNKENGQPISDLICIRIEVLQEHSGAWTSVSFLCYDFILYQDHLTSMLDLILNRASAVYEMKEENLISESDSKLDTISERSTLFHKEAIGYEAQDNTNHIDGEGFIHIQPPKLDRESNILKEDHLEIFSSCLPDRFSSSDMFLVYSTHVHGISMSTLYRRMEQYGGSSIFVIEDTLGNVFGSFISTYLRPETHYYGTGETFLFKLEPHASVFPWSKANDFFICGSNDHIAFGGGSDGKFGLWIDENLWNGSSDECETFANTCLSSQKDFKCKVLEIWGFCPRIS